MSTQKPRLTILAAIVSQAKNGENGAFQEVLPVRRPHIRTITLRTWSRSPHETGFWRCTDSILCRSGKKLQEKWAIAWDAKQDGPLSTAQGNSALPQTNLTGQPASYQSAP